MGQGREAVASAERESTQGYPESTQSTQGLDAPRSVVREVSPEGSAFQSQGPEHAGPACLR